MIINFERFPVEPVAGESYAEGAYCPLNDYNSPAERARLSRALVQWHTFVGCCVAEREANFHDDSDFFMTVYFPGEDRFAEIQFATTRGWTYPAMGSAVDATPEVLVRWEAYQLQQRAEARERAEVKRAADRAALDARTEQAAAAAGVALERVQAMLAGSGRDLGEAMLALLIKAPRPGTFRASLRDQVMAWLQDQAPQHRAPLSDRQAGCLLAGPRRPGWRR